MLKGPRYSPEDVEARVVPEIVAALYPILHPAEQQDCAIQDRNHKRATSIATMAWRMFTKRLALPSNFGAVVNRLSAWRDADHEDNIVLCRSDVITLLEGCRVASAVSE